LIPDKLETRGTPVPVLDDVAYDAVRQAGGLDFSREPSGHGTLVYRRASAAVAAARSTLQWVNSAGNREPLRATPGAYQEVSLSPDGKRVALVVTEGGGWDIWVYDPQRDAMTRITFGGGVNRFPVWSPDSQYVVFTFIGHGIYQARADGAGQPVALTESKSFLIPWSFTPDGKRLAYYALAGNRQIWTVPLEEQGGRLKAGKPEQFLKSSFDDYNPSFSPDGRWLAYQSIESGKNEVYVRAFPPPASG
jgi:Tol biopolymer transport system component